MRKKKNNGPRWWKRRKKDCPDGIKIVIESQSLGFTIPGAWRWKVTVGDRYAEEMVFEDMLGMVAALTLPMQQPLASLHWLKTKEEHDRSHQTLNIETDDDPDVHFY